jgi:copper chaperone CopZ
MMIHMLSLLCLLFAVSCSASKQTIETAGAPMAAAREIGDGLPQDDPSLITATSLALHIRGMSCPKCVTNAEIQLERLPGVSGAMLDMSGGTFRIKVKPGAPVTRGNLARAIWVAGFTLVEIEELSS